jgi:phage tail protein X
LAALSYGRPMTVFGAVADARAALAAYQPAL